MNGSTPTPLTSVCQRKGLSKDRLEALWLKASGDLDLNAFQDLITLLRAHEATSLITHYFGISFQAICLQYRQLIDMHRAGCVRILNNDNFSPVVRFQALCRLIELEDLPDKRSIERQFPQAAAWLTDFSLLRFELCVIVMHDIHSSDEVRKKAEWLAATMLRDYERDDWYEAWGIDPQSELKAALRYETMSDEDFFESVFEKRYRPLGTGRRDSSLYLELVTACRTPTPQPRKEASC
ncbi:hypothetical protein KBC99_01280 [Candidatus Saccharibacteria bacterium]|nr:hypothetical protein [Candidatus Saccharibacteria bacterium]